MLWIQAVFAQGVLTPFDRLDGYERRIQSGSAAERSAGEVSTSGAPTAWRGSTGMQYFLLNRGGLCSDWPRNGRCVCDSSAM